MNFTIIRLEEAKKEGKAIGYLELTNTNVLESNATVHIAGGLIISDTPTVILYRFVVIVMSNELRVSHLVQRWEVVRY